MSLDHDGIIVGYNKKSVNISQIAQNITSDLEEWASNTNQKVNPFKEDTLLNDHQKNFETVVDSKTQDITGEDLTQTALFENKNLNFKEHKEQDL